MTETAADKRASKYVGIELKGLKYTGTGDHYLNPYITKAKELTGLLYTLEDFEKNYPAIFPDPALPLVVEIGCYKGDTVIELAEYNKEINILGIDIKYKRVVISCEKIKKKGFENCKIALSDAGEIIQKLPENSLLGVFAFFPDPWVKEKQQKHRLLTRDFFTGIYPKLTAGGFTWIKTDNKTYFDQVTDSIKKSGFNITGALPGTIAAREYKTLFEKRFGEQNKTIYQVLALKKES